MVELDLSVAHFKGLSLHVVFMLIPMIHNYKREEHADILNAITDIIEAGDLTPVLDEQEFSLAEVAQAHDRLSSGQAMGKVVVTN
jgi:NADPH2:quinone reductase